LLLPDETHSPCALPTTLDCGEGPSVSRSSVAYRELKGLGSSGLGSRPISTALGSFPLSVSWRKKCRWVVFSWRAAAVDRRAEMAASSTATRRSTDGGVAMVYVFSDGFGGQVQSVICIFIAQDLVTITVINCDCELLMEGNMSGKLFS